MESIFLQTSLIAAFVAGMVALFAPCCITFLLPAYLGSVFKEKEKVILMTLVFGLGIFVVLLPAVLGVAFISKMLFRYHDTVYILGGVVMLAVAAMSLLNVKLPMLKITRDETGGKTDVLSIFTLGIFSGLTSACCAPVLIGILALTFLSPSFFGALLVGGMYVLGMVTPLLVMSLFLSGKVAKLAVLRKSSGTINLLGQKIPLIASNLVAAAVFFLTGLLTLVLASTGRLSMEMAEGFTKAIQNVGSLVDTVVGGNLVVNLVFLGALGLFLFWLSRKV